MIHAVRRPTLASAFALAMAAVLSAPATAQGPSGPPNALQGFSQNRDKPVQIDAASLEVRDKDKMATFLGNVRVVQGDTTMRCKTLVVFYDQEAAAGAVTAASAGPGGSQQIKRLEANGDVVVTQKDQMVTGAKGVFDMKSNTVTLRGGVVLTQGTNVAKGQRLVTDLTTGTSKLECDDPAQCRVSVLIENGGGPSQRKTP